MDLSHCPLNLNIPSSYPAIRAPSLQKLMYALGQVHKSSSPSSSRPSASSRWRIQSIKRRASTDTRDDSTELSLVEGQFQFQFRARNLVPNLVTEGLSASRIRAEPQFRLIKTSDLAWISERVRKSHRANKPLLFPDRARGGILWSIMYQPRRPLRYSCTCSRNLYSL
jgi:hypothetical protein